MPSKFLTFGVWLSVGLSVGFWLTQVNSPVHPSQISSVTQPEAPQPDAESQQALKILSAPRAPVTPAKLPNVTVFAVISEQTGYGIVQMSVNNEPVNTLRVGDLVEPGLRLTAVTDTEVVLSTVGTEQVVLRIPLPELPELPSN